MLYATTRRFLEVFGLSALEELPTLRDLQEIAPNAASAEAATDVPAAAGTSPRFDEGDADALGTNEDAAWDFPARAAPLDELGDADDAASDGGEDEPEERVGKPH
jgi:hypothetical protein